MTEEIPPHSPLDEEFVDAEEGEEEEPTLIKKELYLETVDSQQLSTEDKKVVHEEDRTEDQVPDISGTEEGNPNLEHDAMTTSADEIEDLPTGDEEKVPDEGVEEVEEAKGDEVLDQQENSQAESGAEIPVDVFEEEAAPPRAEEPATEEVVEETPVTEEITEVTEEPSEEPATAVEEPVAEPEPEPEQQAEPELEPEAEALAEQEDAAEPESEPTQEASEEADEKSFHLQDVPTPKRPRTPNELDAPVEEEPKEINEVAAEPEKEASAPQSPTKSPTKTSQPATPSVVEPVENGLPSSPTKGSNAGSVPPTPKTPISQSGTVPGSPGNVRRSSQVSTTTPKSPMANGMVQPGTPVVIQNNVGSPTPTTPRSGAVAPSPRTPKSGAKGGKASEFVFEKDESPLPQQPRTPKKTTFEDEQLQVKSPTKKRSKSPRSPKKKVRGGAAARGGEEEAEPVSEEAPPPVSEESEIKDIPVEVSEEEPAALVEASDEVTEAPEEAVEQPKEAEETKEEVETVTSPRRRVQSPSPPPSGRGRSERDATRDYVPYDQDSHKEPVPPRMPTEHSFNSYAPPERASYQNISPWVNTANKYKNEHTSAMPFVPQSAYTSFFDDVVNTGAFSHSLYATSRLLERSRSRTRERRSAMRSQRSASNYYRFASQYPAPLRTRDYSTPPSTAISRAPSRAGSFISFLDYAGYKQYDLVRGGSRGSLYDSNQALSRYASRGNIDYYLGAGRVSRVDSYVNNLNSRYEWQVPSNYDTYRSASRSHVNYPPVNQYETYFNYPSTYNDSAYQRQANEENARSLRRFEGNVRNLFESRVDDLQRSLSRERYARDRLRSKYTQTAYQLEQACKQMDLLRCGSYSSLRSGSQPRTSIYTQFYPYY